MTVMRLHYHTSCTVCSDNINKQNEIHDSLHLFDNGALPRLTSTCTEKKKCQQVRKSGNYKIIMIIIEVRCT